MSGNMIPFGERDGQLFQADEVANGLKCQCVCPECQRCYLISEAGLEVCGYCGSTEFRGVIYTHDYLATAQSRMRSSPKPDSSVGRVSVLHREP